MMNYKPLEQDYRVWLVVSPSTWLIPILLVVALVALLVHVYAFSLEGQGWEAPAPAAVEAAAPAVEAAPAAPAVEAAPAQ